MHARKLKRVEFLELFGQNGRNQPLSFGLIAQLPNNPPFFDEIWAVWEENESPFSDALPSVLLIADGQLDDFLAWATTFLQDFRPFTSYFRVLEWSSYERAYNAVGSRHLASQTSALIGLILGETLTQTKSRAAVSSMPVQGFMSTYSYALARSWCVGLGGFREAQNIWEQLYLLTGQSSRSLGVTRIAEIWSIIAAAWSDEVSDTIKSRPSTILARACRELWQERKLSSATWAELSDGRVDFYLLRREMEAHKERRVHLFENVVESLINSDRRENTELDSFLAGYAASLLSNGTLDHADLLFPLVDRFPTLLLWYGVCSGFSAESRVCNAYQGIGHRLLRDLTKRDSIFSRPTADISFHELRILARTSGASLEMRQSGASWLLVEISPLVIALFRWPQRRDGATQLSFMGEPEAKTPYALEALERIRHLLDSAADLNYDLMMKLSGETLSDSRRKRGRSRK